MTCFFVVYFFGKMTARCFACWNPLCERSIFSIFQDRIHIPKWNLHPQLKFFYVILFTPPVHPSNTPAITEYHRYFDAVSAQPAFFLEFLLFTQFYDPPFSKCSHWSLYPSPSLHRSSLAGSFYRLACTMFERMDSMSGWLSSSRCSGQGFDHGVNDDPGDNTTRVKCRWGVYCIK